MKFLQLRISDLAVFLAFMPKMKFLQVIRGTCVAGVDWCNSHRSHCSWLKMRQIRLKMRCGVLDAVSKTLSERIRVLFGLYLPPYQIVSK